MKRLFISLAVIAGMSAQAQFKPKAAFDYFPTGYRQKVVMPLPASTGMNEIESIVDFGNFRVRIGAEYQIKKVSVYFDQSIYMNKAQNVAFVPLQAEWYAGMKYEIVKGVSLKYEHLCIHPIQTNGGIKTGAYGGYNMISIGYGY